MFRNSQAENAIANPANRTIKLIPSPVQSKVIEAENDGSTIGQWLSVGSMRPVNHRVDETYISQSETKPRVGEERSKCIANSMSH